MGRHWLWLKEGLGERSLVARSGEMDYDKDKVDEMVLALLSLGLFHEGPTWRAWKGFDWDALDRFTRERLYFESQKHGAFRGYERRRRQTGAGALQSALPKQHGRTVERQIGSLLISFDHRKNPILTSVMLL